MNTTTFAEINRIAAAHHTREAALAVRPVLTPRGVAVAQIVRLEQTLTELCGPDRAHVLGLLRNLVDGGDIV